MTEENSKSESKNWPIIWAICAVFIVLLVCGLNWYFLQNGDENRGTFGDMFGVSNAIFSGLALAGLIYAIIQQQEQLSIAREDLERTKSLSQEQSDHIRKQNELALKRDAESTFFQMLSTIDTIEAGLKFHTRFGGDLTQVEGANALDNVYDRSSCHSINLNTFDWKISGEIDILPLMQILASSVLYADENFKGNTKFVDLCSATASQNKLVLFGLYALWDKNEHLIEIIEKTHFLKRLPETGDNYIKYVRKHFSVEAFECK
ncbi:hypothetical protein [Hirschia maritima]|uniref:hypothetical protein n=1 Tax=Hirschia maritima TaxID=1121961 RepID=UPI00035EBF05|nr:hypothetical protein [Hirschia maritima]